ncbi:MAG: hypothetical protein V4475_08660 [Pseudomonadota bacterium]
MIPPALRSRYAEPWRFYHTLAHIEAMEEHLLAATDAGVAVCNAPACHAFIWWHDAIYDPEAAPGHNEMRSAELCRAEMSGVGADLNVIAQAAAMIEATARHIAPPAEIAPDAPLMLDIDLSILGAARDAYRAYADAIRREYAHVADAAYSEGRARVLRGFLDRPDLYLTGWARDRWDANARDNLAWEIGLLTGDRPPITPG